MIETLNRRTLLALSGLAIAFLFASLSRAEVVNSYYPLHVGNRWVYETAFSKDEETPQKVETVVESRELNGGEYFYKVVSYNNKSDSDDGFNLIRVSETGDILFAALGVLQMGIIMENDPPSMFMSGQPDSVGCSWEIVDEVYNDAYPDSALYSVTKYLVESIQDTISVPAGTFLNCIKIKEECYLQDVKTGDTVFSWYAPNVGKIARIREFANNPSNIEVLMEYEVKNSDK